MKSCFSPSHQQRRNLYQNPGAKHYMSELQLLFAPDSDHELAVFSEVTHPVIRSYVSGGGMNYLIDVVC